MQPPIRIGARASKLSQTQSRWVQRRVAAALGADPTDLNEVEAVAPLVLITTTGDRIQDRRLLEVGGKQLFTKEIEEALLDGRVDLAVHSMKDVPAEQPPGLLIAAVPEREDVRDAFVSNHWRSMADLPAGARLGTASLRRQAQALAVRPDLEIVMLRGNVDTRLAKLDAGACDAALLAMSGLNRLGLRSVVREALDPEAAPPAPGQGALAIQARAADALSPLLATLHDPEAEITATAERGALEALEGSCRTAMGAHARLDGVRLTLIVEALTADGRQRWRQEGSVGLDQGDPVATAKLLGLRLGAEIREEAGERLLVA